jgi:16S rRNA (uracil1498-N3)-methyltransferase
MTRRRWIADRVEHDRAYLLGQNAAHLVRVLRVRVGEEFDVVAEGTLRLGKVLRATDDRVEFQLGAEIASAALPHVAVFISIFKFERLEWALEKLTELGVTAITPVIAQRSGQHLVKAATTRVTRWRKIVHEAAQQSRRIAPPDVAEPVPLNKILSATHGAHIVLSEAEQGVSLKAVLADARAPVALAFGPEGGWTEQELQFFMDAGWKSASLGQTILRAETAAIAAVAVAMACLD